MSPVEGRRLKTRRPEPFGPPASAEAQPGPAVSGRLSKRIAKFLYPKIFKVSIQYTDKIKGAEIGGICMEEMELVSIERLRLLARVPQFATRIINLPKLSRTLRGKGYDINIIREGQNVEIPIPAVKEDHTVFLDPVERVVFVDAENLRDANEGLQSILQILKRDFKVVRVDEYILDVSTTVKSCVERVSEMINRCVIMKKGLRDIVGENALVSGLKIVIDNMTITIDEWGTDPSYYLLRIVRRSKTLEDISEFNPEELSINLISRVEEV